MKNSVTVQAYCKINLSLDIKGLRSDGKHEVDMCMQSVPLFDIVEIKKFPSKERNIILKASEEWVPTDSKNTANTTKAKANASATATSTTLSDKYKNEKIKK